MLTASRARRVLAAAASVATLVGFGLSGSAGADDASGHATGVTSTLDALVTTLVVPPTPTVVDPPGGSTSLLNVNQPGLVTTGVLNVASNTISGGNASAASVTNANVVNGLVTAGVLTSECSATSAATSGSSSLANAQAGGVPLNANPPPNTAVVVPLVGTVTLNEQQTTSSGIRVRALHALIATPFGVTIDVIISESACFSGVEAEAAAATSATPNLTG